MTSHVATQRTDDVQFRQATRDDAALVIQLLRESAIEQGVEDEFFTTEADIRRYIFGDSPKATILIIEKSGETAGLTVFFYNFASFIGCAGIYIEDIYVRPAFQGLGIGKQVFQHLAHHALEQGCGLLEWMVLNDNEKARGFYQKLGAYAVDDWKVNRLKGAALKKMAGKTI